MCPFFNFLDTDFRLTKITEVVEVTSEFAYGTSDFIANLITPYGITKFAMGEGGGKRWLEATDPLGQKEHVRYEN